MAHQTELEISRREVMGKKTKRLRKEGIIPAHIFGHHLDSQSVQVSALNFSRLLRGRAAASIITLRMADSGETQTALIRHVQHDPRSGKVIHIDFFRVSLTERINIKASLRFVGEAPAVKNESGVVLYLMDVVEIECLASDIPEYIEVDITPLAEIDDILHASDIKLPATFTLITDPRDGVVKVAATRVEKEEEVAEAAAAAPATTETSGEGSSEE